MTICNKDHRKVVYNGEKQGCPLCVEIKARDAAWATIRETDTVIMLLRARIIELERALKERTP